MRIPFTKAHGAKNDFVLTRIREIPEEAGLPAVAKAICDRNTGIGADGWIVVDERPGIRFFNSDGSEPELSGNGTRCAAAFLIVDESATQIKAGEEIRIATPAGIKELRVISRNGLEFQFEMNMGRPRVIAASYPLQVQSGILDVTMIDVGNPQCAVPVDDFDFDWERVGAEIEKHNRFPSHTNVSFVRSVDEHTIEVRFFERGAGATMSSGTGSTGAAVCAMERKFVHSPVRVLTQAGALEIIARNDDPGDARGDLYLRGPAAIVAEGTFFYSV